MTRIIRLILSFLLGFGLVSISLQYQVIANEQTSSKLSLAQQSCPKWMNHQLEQLHKDNQVNLCDLAANKTVLMVNTASHCGFTGQFEGLESLYQKYKHQGLVVIGFPSNDFNQEADSAAETAKVCYLNYGVSFFMSEKIHVKGSSAHPIFQHLAMQHGSPRWNFNKYLINAHGQVVEKFSSSIRPDSATLIRAIEESLKDRSLDTQLGQL